jgi:membrane protein DedA with SNARE-associated domain
VTGFIDQVGLFIEANQMWAGPILGILAFGESMAILGLFVPATALMLLAGGLVGTGTLDAAPVLLWSMAGASIGDAVSYYLGRKIGFKALRRWPLNRDRHSVARGRLFFRKYGWLSIFIGRFLGPIRAIVPLIAGMMEMNHRKFQTANVLSAIVWVPVMLTPGYIAAKGLVNVGEISEGEWIGLVALVAIGTVVGSWAILRLFNGKGKVRQRRLRPAPVRLNAE